MAWAGKGRAPRFSLPLPLSQAGRAEWTPSLSAPHHASASQNPGPTGAHGTAAVRACRRPARAWGRTGLLSRNTHPLWSWQAALHQRGRKQDGDTSPPQLPVPELTPEKAGTEPGQCSPALQGGLGPHPLQQPLANTSARCLFAHRTQAGPGTPAPLWARVPLLTNIPWYCPHPPLTNAEKGTRRGAPSPAVRPPAPSGHVRFTDTWRRAFLSDSQGPRAVHRPLWARSPTSERLQGLGASPGHERRQPDRHVGPSQTGPSPPVSLPPGDTPECLDTFLVVTAGGAPGIESGEARHGPDTVQRPGRPPM